MRRGSLAAVALVALALAACSTGQNAGDQSVIVVRSGLDLSAMAPDVTELAFLPGNAHSSGLGASVNEVGDASITQNERTCRDGTLAYLPYSVDAYQWVYGVEGEGTYFNLFILEVSAARDAQDALKSYRAVLDNCLDSAGSFVTGADQPASFLIGDTAGVTDAVGPYIVSVGYVPSRVNLNDAISVIAAVRSKMEEGAVTGTVAGTGSGAPDWAPECPGGASLTTATRTNDVVIGLCDDYSMIYEDSTTGRTEVFADAGGAGGQVCGESDDGFTVCTDFESTVTFPPDGVAKIVLEFWYGTQ